MGLLDSIIKQKEKFWFELKDPEKCAFPKKNKIINDSVYGTIKLERPVVFLIDLPCFQRLRRIRQLGFLDYVYPGAHHNRFEHSIGTMHLSGQFLLNMKTNNTELEEVITSEVILENKLASLYHDIGHLPFSHVTESLLYNEDELINDLKEVPYDDVKAHEYLGKKIIENKYVSKAIERINSEINTELSPASLGELMLGGAPREHPHWRFLGQLIHGAVDVDRIDYLNRDAHYAGVPFGKVDTDRLFQTTNVNKDPKNYLDLVIEQKGLQSIESLLTSRTLMYSSVYYHHTSRAISTLFSRIVYSYFSRHSENFLKLLLFDDNALCIMLKQDETSKKRLENIYYRKIPKIALSLNGNNINNVVNFKTFTKDLNYRNTLKIEEEIGEGVLIDIPPLQKYEEINAFILSDDGVAEISDISNIVKGIVENKKLSWLGYVFAANENLKKATDAAKEYFTTNNLGIRV
jgi:hypothetical protein